MRRGGVGTRLAGRPDARLGTSRIFGRGRSGGLITTSSRSSRSALWQRHSLRSALASLPSCSCRSSTSNGVTVGLSQPALPARRGRRQRHRRYCAACESGAEDWKCLRGRTRISLVAQQVNPESSTLSAVTSRGEWLTPAEAAEAARSAQQIARTQRERAELQRRRAEQVTAAGRLLLTTALETTDPAEAQRLRHQMAELTSELDGLRTAMQTRAAIEQAKGIVMAAVHCDPDEAFNHLVRQSQATHMKLNEVAARLVAETSRTAAQASSPDD